MRYTLIIIFFITNSLFSFCQEENIEPYKVLKGHKHKVQIAFFSPDGKYLIAGTQESNILAWKMESLIEP